MSDQVNIVHLVGRHPEIAQRKDFLDWLQVYGGEIWHETPVAEDGSSVVVIQSNNRLNLFAVQLRRKPESSEKGANQYEVLRTANIDLVQQGFSPNIAAGIVRNEFQASNAQIHAIRPVVSFQDEPTVSWEIEVLDGTAVRAFRADSPDSISLLETRQAKNGKVPTSGDNLVPPTNDWLEENECHHLSAWRSLARQIVGAAGTAQDQAFAIWLAVRQRMSYDATITNIGEFTWSDNLVINQNGWRGICDEWAVVQITLLRAIGIPAVLKFLIWQSGGKPVGHACLEWSDNGAWRHMDALWNAFDNRAVYRQQGGASNVTIMDGNSPLDSRYNGLAWGVLDVPGDQKFYPYGDFIINPPYPGNQRPGYSY